ncbi:hypothetical protein FACS189418_0550 [Clostridia bacterium]|nr:hypothetical protein FACS189418_0550 [Clostridia bacterium]
MREVQFYDLEKIEESFLSFAVICAQYQHQWILCKNAEKSTYEFPGGCREVDESIMDTANRELYEETGAIDFTLTPIGVFSVQKNELQGSSKLKYGIFFYGKVDKIGELPDYEIKEICFRDDFPIEWTYPNIQAILIDQLNLFLKKSRLKIEDEKN